MVAYSGQQAVGVGIARDIVKDVGVFKVEVMHVKEHRRRQICHVQYEDGDSEDFNLAEYQYAFELGQAVDSGKFRSEDKSVQNKDDKISNDRTEDEWDAKEVDSVGEGSEDDTNTPTKRTRTKKSSTKNNVN